MAFVFIVCPYFTKSPYYKAYFLYIVAVRLCHRGLDLLGGHVESYETTPEQTMNREAMEEACITIRGPALVEGIDGLTILIKSVICSFTAPTSTIYFRLTLPSKR